MFAHSRQPKTFCHGIPTDIPQTLIPFALLPAATTALQTMHPLGREMGVRHGANVIMPQATPARVRRNYQLYEGKPCLDESSEQCLEGLEERIKGVGRELAVDDRGDSAHAMSRQG
ncbi:MAG: hypothetical protein PHV34_17930 [Verrucomicrobiae bacterium]|nr:hypothetical protein [Verrucomicrobiae bacterium]